MIKKNSKGSILIFGGSGGLGSEIAKNFCQQGYDMVLTYRKNAKEIKKILKKFNEKKSNKIFYSKCDFNNENSIKKTIKFAIKKNGEPKYIINSVGVFYYDNLKKFNYKKINEIFKINAYSVLAINKTLYNLKKSKKIIKIISIGSSSALNGFKDTFSYCGSKHALLGIVRSLNETIYRKKIFNYCLNLGSIKNKMGKKVRSKEFKNFINPQSAVKAINFLTSLEVPALTEELFVKRFRF
tara:strand:- start:425 stop:1144 length:720 start_codon:yes stop_codon:yes gene_type:complete